MRRSLQLIGPISVAGAPQTWVPRGFDGHGGAIDFAVTSGLRTDRISAAATDPSSIVAAYEEHKRRYLDTERQCNEQGFQFLPFVVEAHGVGLAIGGRRIISVIAKSVAARNGEEIEDAIARR